MICNAAKNLGLYWDCVWFNEPHASQIAAPKYAQLVSFNLLFPYLDALLISATKSEGQADAFVRADQGTMFIVT